MRISTQAASQSALMDLMRAQRDAFEAREQYSTGKRAPDLKGYGHEAETILAARGALERNESFNSAAKRLDNRLSIQNLALEEISGAVKDLREALTTGDATYMMTEVEESFDRIRAALNTKSNGSYIFGGTRTDTPPFNANSLADLQAAAAIGDVFDNSDRKQTMLIDEDTTVDVGPLASDFATDIMRVFERIADFDAGPNGPFDGPVDAAQQAFLRTEIANTVQAFEQINSETARNGAMQQRIEGEITAQGDRKNYLTQFVEDVEGVDVAGAVTRFQQAQNAIQVSAATFSTLSQVSLLNFLR
ncbi:flagellin [Marinicauda pacifica]|uniref:Flagellin C-terminal domain-containing protein n=1 Tax=Marinicauda pacifica TaxID=1133559 RepID=A0A4S2HD97_9PROT|nr:flagellin [Marinicauda pacifica]TGY93731.1 hypothetical protein E5162_00075 [Marinicauda pacifica]GGE29834.1 flagellin [Marinicauda pacifica]